MIPDLNGCSFQFLGQFNELLNVRYNNPRGLHARLRGERAKFPCLSKFKEVERTYAAAVNALDVSLGDGRFLLSGGGDGSIVVHGVTKPSTTVQQVYPVLGKVPSKSPHAHDYSVSACQFYPHDPGMFITAGTDCQVKLWDTHRMTPAHKFSFDLPILDSHTSSLKSAKPLIAVACMDKYAYICDIRTLARTHTLEGHRAAVTCTRWANDGPYLLATGGADGKILLWDVRKARSCLGHLDSGNNASMAHNAGVVNTAHERSVISLEFAEDAHHLVSFGADHRIRLWSTVSHKNTMVDYGRVAFEFRDMTRHLQMSMSSQTQPSLIYIPSGDKILVYEMMTGVKIATLTAHFGHVLACAYHPSLQYLFSGATDRNILLWAPADEFKDFEEEMEEGRRKQLERSAKRIANGAVQMQQLQMDTWSDDED
ncbi:DNA excision repair protein ERCC-8 [Hypsibius exemplaris]|uniref:DNA excision repair protein ERCC-8 n=1 Tax=Hypsibius exemplaris TaxID=2072580 RepID=A0A1W0WPH1_HYPEX|nr:DNA excision repair protein ERCC-8 [Hypsibius exemplaris]